MHLFIALELQSFQSHNFVFQGINPSLFPDLMPNTQLEQKGPDSVRLQCGDTLIIASLEVSESHISPSQIPLTACVFTLDLWVCFLMSFWKRQRRRKHLARGSEGFDFQKKRKWVWDS